MAKFVKLSRYDGQEIYIDFGFVSCMIKDRKLDCTAIYEKGKTR